MSLNQLVVALCISIFSVMGAVRVSAFFPTAFDGAPSLITSVRHQIVQLRACRSTDRKDTDRPMRLYALFSQDHGRTQPLDRRGLLWLVPSVAFASAIATRPLPVLAAEGTTQQEPDATIWITGKPPRAPGAKAKDKNDVSGTRKDPSFLRSIADCKNKCENSPAPDGLSKSKEECLSECQDICCTTYEQCTFAIVPRI
jgi:hypothetical protein